MLTKIMEILTLFKNDIIDIESAEYLLQNAIENREKFSVSACSKRNTYDIFL